MWRGDRDALKFSVVYLRDSVVEAVLSLNDAKTNEAGGKLIEGRRRVSAAALEDPAIEISELLGAAAS